MFCVTGEWDRALPQLTVAAELDPLALPMAETYRTLIRCEVVRARVFAGTRTPTVLGGPEPWLPLLLAGQPRARRRRHRRGGRAARRGVRAARGRCRHRSTDGAFEWIADADPRLGPVLEAVVDGAYYWVPMTACRASSSSRRPTCATRSGCRPVHLDQRRAQRSASSPPATRAAQARRPALALARRTEWRERARRRTAGRSALGQRMFATDAERGCALMDLRSLARRRRAAAPRAGLSMAELTAASGCSPRCSTG